MSIMDWLQDDNSYESKVATAIPAIPATESDPYIHPLHEIDRDGPEVLTEPTGNLLDLPTWCRSNCENLRHHHLSGLDPLTGCEIVTSTGNWDFYRIDSLTGCPKSTQDSATSDHTVPLICRGCNRLEALEINGKNAHGCCYQTPGEYSDGWRRLPANLERCLKLQHPIRGTRKLLNLDLPTGNLRAWLDEM